MGDLVVGRRWRGPSFRPADPLVAPAVGLVLEAPAPPPPGGGRFGRASFISQLVPLRGGKPFFQGKRQRRIPFFPPPSLGGGPLRALCFHPRGPFSQLG